MLPVANAPCRDGVAQIATRQHRARGLCIPKHKSVSGVASGDESNESAVGSYPRLRISLDFPPASRRWY